MVNALRNVCLEEDRLFIETEVVELTFRVHSESQLVLISNDLEAIKDDLF